MAHECPECGLNCHCGGDIDDTEFQGGEETCTCCDGEDAEGFDDDYLVDGEEADNG